MNEKNEKEIKVGEPSEKPSEPAQKKTTTIKILLFIIPLFAMVLAVSFLIALSVVSPQVQQNVMTEEMEKQIDKEASNLAVQLQSAAPKLQEIIIGLYKIKPERQEQILKLLKSLKKSQENLKKIPELLENPLNSTEENLSLEVLNKEVLGEIGSAKNVLEEYLNLILLEITLKTKAKNILDYYYIELSTITLIIAGTIISVLGLLFINTSSSSQVKKDSNKTFVVSDTIINTYNHSTSIKGKNIIEVSEDWRDVLWGAHKRLRNEEKNMQSRNVNNLITGVGSALLGFSWLLILIFLFNDAEYGDGVLDFLANYWARFSIVLILGLCATFFFRLYTQTIRRIDKNRNEITNIELRLVSGLMLYDKTNSANFSALAKIIAQEERNFVLGKNESSGGIDPSKLLEIIKATK